MSRTPRNELPPEAPPEPGPPVLARAAETRGVISRLKTGAGVCLAVIAGLAAVGGLGYLTISDRLNSIGPPGAVNRLPDWWHSLVNKVAERFH